MAFQLGEARAPALLASPMLGTLFKYIVQFVSYITLLLNLTTMYLILLLLVVMLECDATFIPSPLCLQERQPLESPVVLAIVKSGSKERVPMR